MKKVIKLTEGQLIQQIRGSISKVLNESDYSSDVDKPTQPREYDVKSIFGDKYSKYIPNDVIRYLRKNPAMVFKRLYEIYGEDVYMYLDKAKGEAGSDQEVEMRNESMMESDFEDFDEDEEDMSSDKFMDRLKEVINGDEEFIDADIEEIFSYNGFKRSFRGSIYIDGVVPETDDKEFDRKVAIKVMEFFAEKIDTNQYVGGVGFKQRSITNPFDNENF